MGARAGRWCVFFLFLAAACRTESPSSGVLEEEGRGGAQGLSASTEQFLQEWDANPKVMMNRAPIKRNWRGEPTTVAQPFQQMKGSAMQVRDEARIEIMCMQHPDKKACRDEIVNGGGQEPSLGHDDVRNLVDNDGDMIETLDAMEMRGLRTARLAMSPWSDYYWAIFEGILGFRYADPSWPKGGDWKKKNDYVAGIKLKKVYDAGDAQAIDRLSPGEKFDLIIGQSDANGGVGALTANMWAQGREYYESSGKVESWMGICHGWAPASYMMARPAKTIQVADFHNRVKIKLYPSDLKSLATLLWAQGRSPTKFIGDRCNDKDPEQDANGRIKAGGCRDNNPGTWHKAVVNQVGVARRSFVIDATYDYEVWNQPMFSYEYVYFNPVTKKTVNSLAEATVALPFDGDKFAAYRAPNAKSVVGIAMRAGYVVETNPNRELSDAPERDAIHTADYVYDVELTDGGQIIGGEWYENTHPDFMWTPERDGRATTYGDTAATDNWSGNGPIPPSWRQAAAADAGSGTPLGKLVYALIDRAAN